MIFASIETNFFANSGSNWVPAHLAISAIAIAEIARCAGTQFDPELAKKFVSIEAKINAARLAPEVEYPKFSLLAKNIDFKVTSEFSNLNL